MISKRRTKEEIIAQILKTTLEEVSKSRIMYDSLLNYNQLEKYLRYMLDLKLIRYDGKRYTITDKGREYLELFNELKDVENIVNTKYSLLVKFLR